MPEFNYTYVVEDVEKTVQITYSINPYPSCCGSKIYHAFTIMDNRSCYITKKEFNKYIDKKDFFKKLKQALVNDQPYNILTQGQRIFLTAVNYNKKRLNEEGEELSFDTKRKMFTLYDIAIGLGMVKQRSWWNPNSYNHIVSFYMDTGYNK